MGLYLDTSIKRKGIVVSVCRLATSASSIRSSQCLKRDAKSLNYHIVCWYRIVMRSRHPVYPDGSNVFERVGHVLPLAQGQRRARSEGHFKVAANCSLRPGWRAVDLVKSL
jgi:hypothetical protein